MAKAGVHTMDGCSLRYDDVQICHCLRHLFPHAQSRAIDQPFLPHVQILCGVLLHHSEVGKECAEGIPLQFFFIEIVFPPAEEG